MIVADQVAQWLAEKEISHAFGIIGAGNVSLWDAIARLGRTELIPVHHEQAGAMASSYFNRIRGRIGSVVLLTTGGGAANAITGVLAAYMDSIPLLVLSGNEPSPYLEKTMRVQGVQGFQTSETVKPFCKLAHGARSDRALLMMLQFAFDIAQKPRPGPAWVDIPRDIQVKEAV